MGTTAPNGGSLRVGIVGAGFLGRRLAGQFAAVDDAVVVAMTDIDEKTLASAATEFGVPESSRYVDLESMIESESLDALVITTPHTLHAKQIRIGLDSDLHVLCEKPLCTSVADARNLVERTERSDRTVMVGYQRHVDGAFIEARSFWRESDRTPSFVNAELVQDWIDTAAGAWRTDPDLSGGGMLYDSGSHLVDAVLWTTGLTPASVSADMSFYNDAKRVDTQATMSVRFQEGAVASISVSGVASSVSMGIHAWSDGGATKIEGREWNDRGFRRVTPEGDIVDPNIPRGNVRSKADAFVEAVREGTEPPATVYDGLRATALTEAAYEAARTGERVDVDL